MELARWFDCLDCAASYCVWKRINVPLHRLLCVEHVEEFNKPVLYLVVGVALLVQQGICHRWPLVLQSEVLHHVAAC